MQTAAIILAAGQGTRMKSATPKVLHAAAGLPLVAYPLRSAQALGCQPVVLVVGPNATAVEQAAAAHLPGVRIAVQAQQNGTAHAVGCGLPEASTADWVYILYGDCPLLTVETLRTLEQRTTAAGTPLGFITAVVDKPTGYGRVVRGPDGRVQSVVEHKDCTDVQHAIHEVNAGVYLVSRAFLAQALAQVGTANAQQEFYLPDIVAQAAARGGVTAHAVDAVEMLGVNTRVELAAVESVLQQRLRTAAMAGGCTMVDPATVYLDADVTLEADVTLGPGVQLRGKTHLCANVTVEGPCVLLNCHVDSGTIIKAFSHLEGARVGVDARVGPYARLRPDTVLEANVHVGNFVEVKKTTLAQGAKANHLAYLGDSTVGARTNVGAGTITCNYDGVGKYLTRLGADVFVGSNSTLVAPVTVGDGAYVAAGSVITQDVPGGSLALGRARQVVKTDRAEQVRNRAQQKTGANRAPRG